MPRRARKNLDAACFHVVNRSAQRVALFQKATDYRAFVSILVQGLERLVQAGTLSLRRQAKAPEKQ